MIGMLLSALGGAASSAGLSGLGAGLTAAGQFMGGSGIPGMGGGIPGMGGAPGAGGMPFGMNLANLVKPATENLGTSTGGWQTSVTPEATPGQQLAGGLLQQLQKGGQAQPPQPQQQASIPTVQQRPVDAASMLDIINRRARLGS